MWYHVWGAYHYECKSRGYKIQELTLSSDYNEDLSENWNHLNQKLCIKPGVKIYGLFIEN